jgi:hypothetical protein
MHFLQLLRWCHGAYEQSLESFGLPAASMFPRPEWAGDSPEVALPEGIRLWLEASGRGEGVLPSDLPPAHKPRPWLPPGCRLRTPAAGTGSRR